MTTPPPLPFTYDGLGAMVAMRPKLVARYYGGGEVVMMVPHHERSDASHRHYFACVHEAWMNLPEDLVERYPTSEHLRKVVLIKAGYRDERSIVCASRAEALRVAAFIKPMDEYAVVVVSEAVVTVYTAKSQSVKAMGRADFQASKDAVLGIVSQMIAVTPLQLTRASDPKATEPKELERA